MKNSTQSESRALPVAAHTPVPWKEHDGFIVGRFSDGLIHDVCDPRCAPAELFAEIDANAAFIVRACNSHDELLAALNLLLSEVDAGSKAGDFLNGKRLARAALARATAP